jgi:hypothetical protein
MVKEVSRWEQEREYQANAVNFAPFGLLLKHGAMICTF